MNIEMEQGIWPSMESPKLIESECHTEQSKGLPYSKITYLTAWHRDQEYYLPAKKMDLGENLRKPWKSHHNQEITTKDQSDSSVKNNNRIWDGYIQTNLFFWFLENLY